MAHLPTTSDPSAADRLRANLRMVAALDGTMTYHEAAMSIGLEPPHVIHSVTRLLEILMEQDAEAGHPFIASLVVGRARDGLPQAGFFLKARELGRFDGEAWSAEAMAWHAAELALAHAFHAEVP